MNIEEVIGPKFRHRFEQFIKFVDSQCVIGDDVRLKIDPTDFCNTAKEYLLTLDPPVDLTSSQINHMLTMLDINLGRMILGIKPLKFFKDGEYRLPTKVEIRQMGGETKLIRHQSNI